MFVSHAGNYLIGTYRMSMQTDGGIPWFNLYRKDLSFSTYYDYYYEYRGRSMMGLHPGATSLGKQNKISIWG